MKSDGIQPPGVLAESSLARRFADEFAAKWHEHLTMNVMRLDTVNDVPRAPGQLRALRESDLFFAPYWARGFAEDCNNKVYPPDFEARAAEIKSRVGADMHYFWEVDGTPVSQAVAARKTVNGVTINGVYTPPTFRGLGYATSCVAELSRLLLARGNAFCALFADAKNPISCGIYRKIGFKDAAVTSELYFD
ncbi:MAG: GNAT family N-acetyltransferase [Oscillospiraceae bacterium]|jgi:predicted GNAT family acetyltransferase|nr:GNAT family N-acetyltransferase [Oscillospiraceae bacterium]